MPIKADHQYNGHIENANVIYSNGGTPAIQIHLQCEDGKISHPLWLTEKTLARVEKTLTDLGATKDQLHSEYALENIGEILTGRECSFTTISEEYKGEQRVKVQWINKKRGDTDVSPARMAAALFSGKPLIASKTNGSRSPQKATMAAAEWAVTDDDIPF